LNPKKTIIDQNKFSQLIEYNNVADEIKEKINQLFQEVQNADINDIKNYYTLYHGEKLKSKFYE
jgi:hypothetical protein